MWYYVVRANVTLEWGMFYSTLRKNTKQQTKQQQQKKQNEQKNPTKQQQEETTKKLSVSSAFRFVSVS